jgi:hypothetical protein
MSAPGPVVLNAANGKVNLFRTGHEGPVGGGGVTGSSTPPLTSALDVGGWSSRPGRFTPGKDLMR